MPGANESKFCSHCGTACVPEQRFCANCGKPIVGLLRDSALEAEAVVTPEETAGILLEMADMESFLHKCTSDPDEAMLKIAKFLKVNPDTEETSMILIFRFVALASKAKLSYESNGNMFDPNVFANCKKCLEGFKKARRAVISEGLPDMVTTLEASMDEVAILLEKHVPGKVQEVLGETKIKFLAYGDRLSLHKSVEGRLPDADLREICELAVTCSFTIRYALFASFSGVGPHAQVHIMLYEHPELWGPNDEMRPIKGSLTQTQVADGGRGR